MGKFFTPNKLYKHMHFYNSLIKCFIMFYILHRHLITAKPSIVLNWATDAEFD